MTPPAKKQPDDYDSRENLRRFFQMMNHFSPLWIIAAIGLLTALALSAVSRLKSSSKETVVIYAAQDQVYAEPILREF